MLSVHLFVDVMRSKEPINNKIRILIYVVVFVILFSAVYLLNYKSENNKYIASNKIYMEYKIEDKYYKDYGRCLIFNNKNYCGVNGKTLEVDEYTPINFIGIKKDKSILYSSYCSHKKHLKEYLIQHVYATL